MDAQLPDELIKKIVSNITDFHQLLKLRLVSRSWKDEIEYWLSRRRSLAIMEVGYVSINQYSTLNDRFFRSLENERFMLIQLRHFCAGFNMRFIQTVTRLFRGIQHFAFRATLTPQGVTYLALMLNEWTNLSTLSLRIETSRLDHHVPISFAVNNLKKLIALDLGTPFQMSELDETLARLHYLAVGFVESRKQFLNMITHIGCHCKHLWVENWCNPVVLDSPDIIQWIGANRAFAERLTHIGWPGNITSYITRPGLEVINQSFTSLTTWHVVGEFFDGYILLSLLSRLSELRVLHLTDPFSPIIVLSDHNIIESPSSVRIFELQQAYCSNDFTIDNNVGVFIDQLRLFFPHAERVILTSPHRRTIEILEPCVAGDHKFQILQSERSHVWVRI